MCSPRGEPSATLPPTAFVSFIQNHDQIGNRAFGERLPAIAAPEAVKALAAVYLLLPQIPMLFMGEEWDAAQPFPFFCDFGPALADAVRNGRRDEFARFPAFADPAVRARIPDPLAVETFLAAKLNWDDLNREPHASRFAWYRRILDIRRTEVIPLLRRIGHGGQYAVKGDSAVSVHWAIAGSGTLALDANLSGDACNGFAEAAGRVILSIGDTGTGGTFGPWAVRWSIRDEASLAP